MSKKAIILAIVVISAALILPPIISVVSFKLRIYEILNPVSFILRLMAMIISILSIIQFRRSLKSTDEQKTSNTAKIVIEPILFILIGFFASRIIAFFVFHSMSQHHTFFPIAIMLGPVFLSSIIIAATVGKKGWLFGLLIATVQTYEFLFWEALLNDFWLRLSIMDRVYLLTTTHFSEYYSMKIGLELLLGIMGGSLGHLIGYLFRKLHKKGN